MEFIEAAVFTRYVYECLSDDEYLSLQHFLLLHPESGKIVQAQAVSEKSGGPCQEKVKVAACE